MELTINIPSEPERTNNRERGVDTSEGEGGGGFMLDGFTLKRAPNPRVGEIITAEENERWAGEPLTS